jgi:hypothetical protein
MTVDNYLRLTIILHYEKVETRDHFKKRGESRKAKRVGKIKS